MASYLLVIDPNDQIVEKIPTSYKDQKQTLREAKKKYNCKHYTFQFGNTCTEELYQRCLTYLQDIADNVPEMELKITEKNRSGFKHLEFDFKGKKK